MLRFVLLVIVVYVALRFLGRLFQKPKNVPSFRTAKSARPHGRPASGPPKVIDEMKACPACGTFNPMRLAYEKKGLYFCEERCHEAYHRGERKK